MILCSFSLAVDSVRVVQSFQNFRIVFWAHRDELCILHRVYVLLCFLLAVVSPTKSDLSRLHSCITSGCMWNQCFKVGKGRGNANDYGRVENPTKRLPVFWEFIFRHLENFHGFNFDSSRFKYRYFRRCDANGSTT